MSVRAPEILLAAGFGFLVFLAFKVTELWSFIFGLTIGACFGFFICGAFVLADRADREAAASDDDLRDPPTLS